MTAVLVVKRENFYSKKSNEKCSPLSHAESTISKTTSTATGFHDLPLNVLLKIFSYFSETELQKNIIPVCQKWKYAATRPELWKSLKLTGQKLSANYICYKLRFYPLLERIELINVNEPQQITRQICRCLQYLKHLTLKNCSGISEKSLLNVVCCCKSLESLNLSGTPFKGKRIYESLSLLTRLKSLNLSRNPYMKMKNVTTVIMNCRGLQEFRLSKWITPDEPTRFDDQDVSVIILNLHPNIKSLSLDCSNLTNSTFNKILSCEHLERLCLYRAKNLEGEVFENLYRYFPKLTQLKIKHANQISDTNIINLFTKGDEIMRNLTLLDLSGLWQLTDKGLDIIIRCCKQMKTLYLQNCKSLIIALQMLVDCLNLESLNIAFCSNLYLEDVERIENLRYLVIDEHQEEEIAKKKFYKGIPEIWISKSEFKKNLKKLEFSNK